MSRLLLIVAALCLSMTLTAALPLDRINGHRALVEIPGGTAPTTPAVTPAATPAAAPAAAAAKPASLCAAAGGMCMSALGNSCATGFKSGMCPGASDVKCCVSGLDFAKLQGCYPQGTAQEIKARLGGAVNADWVSNTCAVRMSHTLNCAGKTIPQMGAESIRGEKTKNWNYVFRVKQLSPLVKKMFGLGTTYKAKDGVRGVDVAQLAGKKGIIYFDTTGTWTDATGHFDLWDGKMMVETSHATEATTEKYFKISVSVTLWEFK